MSRLVFALLIAVAPAAASPRVEASSALVAEAAPTNLGNSLKSARFAEIYVIPASVQFAAAPQPETVRHVGCPYWVSREAFDGDSKEWKDLERALAGVRVIPAAEATRRQVRLGLMLGDQRGIIREIYTDSLAFPAGQVFAWDGRRQVQVSEAFASALLDFAAEHPQLAQGPQERCPADPRIAGSEPTPSRPH